MRRAGVERVVLLSSPAVPDGDLSNAIARDHIVSERTVRESSVPFTFIRQKTPKCAPISMSVAGSRR